MVNIILDCFISQVDCNFQVDEVSGRWNSNLGYLNSVKFNWIVQSQIVSHQVYFYVIWNYIYFELLLNPQIVGLSILINSLAPGKSGSNFKRITLKLIIQNISLGTHYEITLKWKP